MSTVKERITEFPTVPKIQETLGEMQTIVETMQSSIKFLKQCKAELEAEVSLVEQERDKAIYWLVKWYQAASREDSESLTEDEVRNEVCDFLFNRGLQPGYPEHHEALATLLNQVEERGDLH